MAIKNWLILCIFILNLNSLFAHRDFVVTLKNDIIMGNIKNSLLGKSKLMYDNGNQSVTISTDNVKEYNINSKKKNFAAKVLLGRKKLVFLERLEKGKIDLYEANSTHYMSSMNEPMMRTSIDWLISKDNSPLFNIRTNSLSFNRKKRKKKLYELIKDNKELSERFLSSNNFPFKKIMEFIIEYNNNYSRID